MFPATCARFALVLLLAASLASSTTGFGMSASINVRIFSLHGSSRKCTTPLQAMMDADGEGASRLSGDRLKKALQYQSVFKEPGMGGDMRKLNVRKVREGKNPVLLESRLAKASRYAAIFEAEGSRGIEKALRVEVHIAKEEIALREEEDSSRRKPSRMVEEARKEEE